MSDTPRLIEVSFPLKQTSLDSVHEKNVRHGHISTLHIWPARRPLAACRAALIATLLPDPGNENERKEILQRLAGTLKEVTNKKGDNKEETEGGILHWGRENSADLDWFREKILGAYGGRVPRVLDPFSGGGAIPLEAMRLGCEVTAIDINPVAWFILKCTLEYPQKLAGEVYPLPDFALQNRDFMESYFKAQGHTKKGIKEQLEKLAFDLKEDQQLRIIDSDKANIEANLAWHVRAWGLWVLNQARQELAEFYPTYAEFQPLKGEIKDNLKRDLKLVPLLVNGELDLDTLNQEFSTEYLEISTNPRWVPKPTVAYLWARTVKCKGCRATLPLLKTRWLCKKDNKRVLLTMEPNTDNTGVVFGIEENVPVVGGNTTQKKNHDKKIGSGTMSSAGAKCPCCPVVMTMADLRLEGKNDRLGSLMTAVVIDGLNGKEYRLPNQLEIAKATQAQDELEQVFADIPFGLPKEPTPKGGNGASRAFSVDGYGFDEWHKLFTSRQLLALGTFVRKTRLLRDVMYKYGYSEDWLSAVIGYSALANDRLADYSSSVCSWHNSKEQLRNTFGRFALPITWDFTEVLPLSQTSGGYWGAIDWIFRFLGHALNISSPNDLPVVIKRSSIQTIETTVDCIITDPPYYDAIPYSDLMDFFYVWLRRTLYGLSPEIDQVFNESLSPKWNHEKNDGELIDDSSRFGGDKKKSKENYENGMYRVFQNCHKALTPEGRLVVVFAHKHPDAWETLVSAMMKAGFIVVGSWPIQTEMSNRTRSLGSAALSSSIWLVCKKRDITARPGWDNKVLEEMQTNITIKLRQYWDEGLRGPDFVWAATGPALEAYSKYPAVKKAHESGELLTVSEFLSQVRRFVLNFVVGRVLYGDQDTHTDETLDDVTTYYLLHRNDFGLKEAPVGASILYAVSCNLSDKSLSDQYDLLSHSSKKSQDIEDDEDDDQEDIDEEISTSKTSSGSEVKLKQWNQRKKKTLGYEAPKGQAIPMIDQIHRLMQLWKGGDVIKVNEYLEKQNLLRHNLFQKFLQALIELAETGSEERSLLESISNHIATKGGTDQLQLF